MTEETEYAIGMAGGGKQVRPNDPDTEEAWPLDRWIAARHIFGEKVFTRRIIVVEDWTEVAKR